MNEIENDLISRSALISYVKELPTYEPTGRGFIFKRYPSGLFAPEDIVKSIQYAPAVDAVAVVHGQWTVIEGDYWNEDVIYQCSVCKEEFVSFDGTTIEKPWNYCANCGADMREG